MKIQACRVIFLIFLGLLSQVASAQPADRNTCNGEVARFLKATNQKYGSNADITFRRTCESSGVSAAYAAVGHSELAPSPAARTSGGAGSQSPARSAPSYSNGPAGGDLSKATPPPANSRSVTATPSISACASACIRSSRPPNRSATSAPTRSRSRSVRRASLREGTPRAGRSVIAAAGSRAPRRCGPGRATPSMWEP